jgi:chromosomal replication initiator protein
VDTNVREIEGAIITLLAQQTFNRKELTAENVKEILAKMVTKHLPELTVERIRQVVCDYFHVSPTLIQEKTRKREVVIVRQVAMYFAKDYTNASLTYIGNQLGRKDHTTVLYAHRVITDLIETDRTFRARMDELRSKITMGT